MVKMIPHHIISKSFSNHPVIKLLRKSGLFNFDEPSNIVQIACDLHYVIPKAFVGDPVIELLTKNGLFDFETEKNSVYLPIDRIVAAKLGVSPYTSEPLDSYMNGVSRILIHLRESSDFALAQRHDKAALKRLEQTLASIQEDMAQALTTGKLFIAAHRD
jgi:hypothetical protein